MKQLRSPYASKELGGAGVSLAFSQVESIKILRRGRCVVLKLYYLREHLQVSNNGLTAL